MFINCDQEHHDSLQVIMSLWFYLIKRLKSSSYSNTSHTEKCKNTTLTNFSKVTAYYDGVINTPTNGNVIQLNHASTCPDPSPPRPLRFVRGGVLYRGLIGMIGCPTVVLTLLSIFFLTRFARQYYTKILHVYILPSSMFNK